MKLLFVSSTFPSPNRPFQGTFNRELVKAIRGAGHEVHVVAPVPWTQQWIASCAAWTNRQKGNVPSPLQGSEHFPIYYYPPGIGRSSYHHFFAWSIRSAVNCLLEHFQPECVVGYWAHPDGQVAVDIARRCGVPGVVLVGGSDVRILAQQQSRRGAIQAALQSADRVVALSEDLRACIAELGMKKEKISVVYRGVDGTLFRPGSREEARAKLGLAREDTILLWVGRFVPVKNPMLFLQVTSLLSKSNPNIFSYMVGDGPMRSSIEREIAKGMGSHVRLLGNLPHTELAEWYRASNVMVLTSDSEGVPNVLLESIACGLPFVATRVGGVPEIASQEHDRLVAPGDVQGLKDAIEDLIQSKTIGVRTFVPQCQADFAQRFMEAITTR